MARTSLVLLGVMALGTSGCLITDKAEFSPPAPTPPFVTNLDPPASEILYIPRKPGAGENDYVRTQNISFDIRSDDMQRPLYSAVLIDFGNPDPVPACPPTLDVGTLDTPRPQACKLYIPASIKPACHSITAIVSHDKSILRGVVPPTPPNGVPDVAMGTWWAQIGTPPDSPDPCEPNPPKDPDAGADARMDGIGR